LRCPCSPACPLWPLCPLGAISRVAPQINIFAIGFPVTLGVGLLGLVLTLPALERPFAMTLEKLLDQFR
jgi:flagellar biosynthesis protein FliR